MIVNPSHSIPGGRKGFRERVAERFAIAAELDRRGVQPDVTMAQADDMLGHFTR